MAGRLSGIFVSKLLKTRTMIAISLVSCLVSATILVIWGDTSPIGVYIGTCMYSCESYLRFECFTLCKKLCKRNGFETTYVENSISGKIKKQRLHST